MELLYVVDVQVHTSDNYLSYLTLPVVERLEINEQPPMLLLAETAGHAGNNSDCRSKTAAYRIARYALNSIVNAINVNRLFVAWIMRHVYRFHATHLGTGNAKSMHRV